MTDERPQVSERGDNWRATLEAAVAPLLERQGYELVLLELVPRSQVLRLFVDHPDGVTLDDCTGVSRVVSDMLDAEGYSDRFRGRFTLEVSSPGLDRPLVKPAHFQRFVGQKARLVTKLPQAGRRNFQGVLVAADAAEVRLEIDGQAFVLRYEQIANARLVPEFSSGAVRP